MSLTIPPRDSAGPVGLLLDDLHGRPGVGGDDVSRLDGLAHQLVGWEDLGKHNVARP